MSRVESVRSRVGGLSDEPVFRRRLQSGRWVRDRDEWLVGVAQGRRVVHVGCVDWPFAEEKLGSGSFLHARLLSVASAVIGVDVDEGGLSLLRDRLGGDYLAADVSVDGPHVEALAEFSADLVLAGDVIEHVPRPVEFLQGLAKLAGTPSSRVVVTTPNALAVRSVLNTLGNIELMHPDHIAVHTPTTLGTLLGRASLEPLDWTYYPVTTGRDAVHRAYDFLPRVAGRLRPGYADGLAVTSRVR